jgi:hypothetical protein
LVWLRILSAPWWPPREHAGEHRARLAVASLVGVGAPDRASGWIPHVLIKNGLIRICMGQRTRFILSLCHQPTRRKEFHDPLLRSLRQQYVIAPHRCERASSRMNAVSKRWHFRKWLSTGRERGRFPQSRNRNGCDRCQAYSAGADGPTPRCICHNSITNAVRSLTARHISVAKLWHCSPHGNLAADGAWVFDRTDVSAGSAQCDEHVIRKELSRV